MPKPEREIFAKCMEQAIGLVWKSLGWHPEDDPINIKDSKSRETAWPFLPEVHVQWDEATCGQVVYLFNETQNNFAGRPEEFFATMARPDQPPSVKNRGGRCRVWGYVHPEFRRASLACCHALLPSA